MDFEVGQVWTRGKGVWEVGKRIVDVDRRRSVTFFKTEDKHGGDASWISADLLTAWVEDFGYSLKPRRCTMTDWTAIDVRGSMKQILREYFPDLSVEKTEEIAERMADAARDYSRAMADSRIGGKLGRVT